MANSALFKSLPPLNIALPVWLATAITRPAIIPVSISATAIGVPFWTIFFWIFLRIASFDQEAAKTFGFFQSIPSSCMPSKAMPEASRTNDATPHDARAPHTAPAAVPAPGAIAVPIKAPAPADGMSIFMVVGKNDAMDSTNISGIAMGLSKSRLPIASRNPSDLVALTRFIVSLVGSFSISDAISINLSISSASNVFVRKSGV